MWPLKKAGSSAIQEYLRVGRHAVERWEGVPRALRLIDRAELSDANMPAMNCDSLKNAIRRLYRDVPVGGVTVLLESAWAPVVLADLGLSIWKQDDALQLLQHRLAVQHGEVMASISTWPIRTDFLPGERFAMGYGISTEVVQALQLASTETGVVWSAWTPAFAWGLDQLLPLKAWPGRSGWWTWQEQDRTLVARIKKARVVLLHPGAGYAHEVDDILRLIDVEAIRSGDVAAALPSAMARWSPELTVEARS